MSIVGNVLEREERPAWVRFERVPVEDKAASLAAGHYVARDVDYAFITPPYSKDVFKIKVAQWFQNLAQDQAAGRIPEKWVRDYKSAYEHWKNGQEIPLNGMPIRGWGVISPAHQETLIRLGILTVEDLAGVNDEGVRRIGMGAIELKNKAIAWLAQLQDKGPLTQEIAALKAENSTLTATVEALKARVDRLLGESGKPERKSEPEPITAADVLDDYEDLAEAYKAKFGRRPHPNINPEKLRRLAQ